MQLTLGPILFDWKKEDILHFYDEVADMPVDRVYIGEVVCAKKNRLSLKDIADIGGRLEKAGKEVIISTLAIVSNEDELKVTRGIVGLPFPVEANDMSVFNIAESQVAAKGGRKEIIAGPHITTYNVPTIQFLQGLGVKRTVFPVEVPGDSIGYNIEHTSIEGEVFVHGKLPLAFSWRCYTSRAYNLNKNNCEYHCRQFPDGMDLKTLNGDPIFTVNGTSILSAKAYTLIGLIEDLREIGAAAIRISPQSRGTARIVDLFRKRLDGVIGSAEALDILKEASSMGLCNGWYMGKAGMEYVL